jgi:hypothetical protein
LPPEADVEISAIQHPRNRDPPDPRRPRQTGPQAVGAAEREMPVSWGNRHDPDVGK